MCHIKSIHTAFNLFLVTFCTLLFIALPLQNVLAQNKVFSTEITQKEKAVFAFFKAGNASPDFEKWVMESSLYKSALESDKQEILIQEQLRLGRGYSYYSLDKDLLEIEIPVTAKYIPPEGGKQARFYFIFPDQYEENYVPVFSYSYGQDTVSMIINRLAAFGNFPLTQRQFEIISERMTRQSEDFDAILIAHVKISSADHTKPYPKPNGGKQWIMVGELGYLSCEINSFFGNKRNQLWDYLAPWYEEDFKLKNMSEEEKYPHPYDLFKEKK